MMKKGYWSWWWPRNKGEVFGIMIVSIVSGLMISGLFMIVFFPVWLGISICIVALFGIFGLFVWDSWKDYKKESKNLELEEK